MNKNEIIKKIKSLTEKGNEEWNHQFEFPFNVHTRERDVESPGYNLNKWKRLKPIIESLDPKNKTFLDVGCSDGYYAIKIAELGAKHVTGTDLDDLRIKRARI